MMQFTETTPLPPLYDLYQNAVGLCLDLGSSGRNYGGARQWPGLSTSTNTKSLSGLNTAGCMEQLLVQCATAIETNDATLAQQILWVLNNIAPPDGDSNQRLTAGFLRALIVRAANTGCCNTLLAASGGADLALRNHRFSPVALASFVDLTPWHRFGYTAANAAIVEAVEGFSVIHIVDLNTTHCMQIPTLIDALASRPEGPPLILRLTLPVPTAASNPTPPLLEVSYDELGSRLVNFARSRNVAMEFKAIPSSPSDAFDALIEQVRLQHMVSDGREALVVNCQMLPHCIPDETAGAIIPTSCAAAPVLAPPPLISLRSVFLKAIRALDPVLVTLVDEDVDLVATDVVGRLRSAFNYLWIPYDAVDTFLPKGSERRQWYEAEVCWKIENVIAHEGVERVERQETRGRWAQRMRGAGFMGAALGNDAVAEVKAMLDEHAAGWGLKREEEDLVLTWKGHNVVFATAWVPC